MTIRVLLADDQALLRATFRLLIDSTDDLHVVGEAATGAQAVTLAAHADVVLMDIRMPDMDGIEATATITADPRLADVRVLVLTTFETDELVLAALRAGATGFLGKGTEPDQLLHAIRTVAVGEALLSPAATTSLIARIVAQPAHSTATGPVPGDLTDRELEITTLVGQGLSNLEIAKRLTISPATAKTHINRAMMKTAARDRAQLVIFAYEHGLLNT
jgi:DNA-binding NarL/FixJ family response regulator